MQPNEPLSLDYLNQIAPEASKKGLPNNIKILAIIVGVVVVLLGILTAFAAMQGSQVSQSEQLIQRLATIKTISAAAKSEIKNNNLSALNADLATFATDKVRIFGEADTSEKNTSNTAARERTNLATLETTLEDARLNAIYDRIYARETLYQLQTLEATLSNLLATSNNAEQKATFEQASRDLISIRERFSAISAEL